MAIDEEVKVVPVMVRCQPGVKVFFGCFIPKKFKRGLMTVPTLFKDVLGIYLTAF